MLKICMFQDRILKAIWSHFGVILELLLGPHVTHQLHIRNLLKTYKKTVVFAIFLHVDQMEIWLQNR